jgi:FkbM family methyltransferase
VKREDAGGIFHVKVAVYTIALNEAAHAERWANSAVDADYRIVADTGSTDDTVERLERAGVTVHRIAVRPWRFDVARNAALALIPDDVDVCLSLDMDRFLAPGWRSKLEAAWTPETTALFCQVVYRSSVDDPKPLRNWSAKNFHHRWGYRFKRPVHEALVFSGPKELTGSCDDIVIYEVQDQTKTTRNQYLPLMELAYQEDPNDGQICFWLGREYMWANRHEQASELLQHYLSLPTSTWSDERSEALRYLARVEPEKKMSWLEKARSEAPHRREIWLDLAEELHGQEDWLNLFWACTNGIAKTHRTGSYLDDNNSWGFRLFDLGAIAAWRLDMMDRAVEWADKALGLDPTNQRLKNNMDFFIRRRDELRAEASTLPRRDRRSDGTVVQNIVKGQDVMFLVTNPNDEIMKHHYAGEFYEVEELELMVRHYSGKGVFVDIGANTGNHSVYISKYTTCPKVIAFEPNPVATPILRQNLALNQCNNVETRFLGLALAAGEARLKAAAAGYNNLGHTRFYEEKSGDVTAVAGDDLLLDEEVEFIKIDVEGMEFEVLSGLEKTIRRWQPTIFIEVWDNCLGSLVQWCERESYQLVERFRRYEQIQNYLLKPLSADANDGPSWRGLAERHRDDGRPFEAAVLFARCERLEQDPEAAWYAQWQKARCMLKAEGEEAFVASSLEAFRARPQRAEPLHDLARYYIGKSRGDLAASYANAGLGLAVPVQDSLGVERQVYESGLKEAFTIAASYSQDAAEKERGRRICNWLALDRDVSPHVRGLARHNLRWYAEPAKALMPSMEFHSIEVPAPEGYKLGNVSLARYGSGFVALIRTVNYDLLESGFFDRHGDTSFRQRTLLVDLDERLQVVSSVEVLEPEDMPPARHTDSLGFEDPRPIVWQGRLWCIACVRQLNDEGRAEMVLARIDRRPDKCLFVDWRVLPSAAPTQWEKNWMPQVVSDELRFIYSVDPIRILGESGTVLMQEPAAIAADNFRGGTQAIPFDGGWLVLIHEWELVGRRRNYLHRFVWLDANDRVVRLSRRFFFQRIVSEFAAGLAWHTTNEHLVVSFGIDDRDPMFSIVRADEVRAALLSVPEHEEASKVACEASRPAWEMLSREGSA